MREFVAYGSTQLEQAAKVIRGLSPERRWRVSIAEYREKRSLEQNALLWAIYTEISKETGNDTEDIHEFCKKKFLPPKLIKIGGEEQTLPGSSAEQDVPSFSMFVERVSAWAAQELGIQIFPE